VEGRRRGSLLTLALHHTCDTAWIGHLCALQCPPIKKYLGTNIVTPGSVMPDNADGLSSDD